MSCLKLSVKSACSNVAILRDNFDVVKEIIKLVKDSPKAEEIKEVGQTPQVESTHSAQPDGQSRVQH